MARARMIAKALSTSAKYASLHQVNKRLAEFCQALYPLLVIHSDDWGRLAGDAFTVKHLVLPTSPRSLKDFEAGLLALDTAGLIVWYIVDDRRYVQIVDFERHQSGLHKRTVSDIPECDGSSGKVREFPSEQKRTEQNRTEGKRTEQKGVRPHGEVALNGFSEFWNAYPRKVGKGAAEGEWVRIRPSPELQAQILAALDRQRVCDQWTKDGGQFIPHPRTWLHQQRWEDEPDTRTGTVTNPKTAGNRAAVAAFIARRMGS